MFIAGKTTREEGIKKTLTKGSSAWPKDFQRKRNHAQRNLINEKTTIWFSIITFNPNLYITHKNSINYTVTVKIIYTAARTETGFRAEPQVCFRNKPFTKLRYIEKAEQ